MNAFIKCKNEKSKFNIIYRRNPILILKANKLNQQMMQQPERP